MNTNKWVLAVVVVVLTLCLSSQGFQAKSDEDIPLTGSYHFTGETLVQTCKSVENADPVAKTVPMKDANAVGTCMGFISGILDLNAMDQDFLKKPVHTWCVPAGVTGIQLAKVVVKYGNDHPEELHFPGVMVVADALISAFPCGH